MKAPDDYLFLEVLEHNEIAYKKLNEKYINIIKSIIRKYYNIIKAKNINYEELLLECNLTFLKSLYKYDIYKENLMSTYIYKCIENTIKTIIVQKYNIVDYNFEDGKSIFDFIEDNRFLPNLSIEFLEKIMELKNDLSPKENIVLNMLIYGNSIEEISDYLNNDKKQIYNCLSRIRFKTKIILNC